MILLRFFFVIYMVRFCHYFMDAGNTLISFFRMSVFSLVCICLTQSLTQSLTVKDLLNSLTVVFKFISPSFLVPEDFYEWLYYWAQLLSWFLVLTASAFSPSLLDFNITKPTSVFLGIFYYVFLDPLVYKLW